MSRSFPRYVVQLPLGFVGTQEVGNQGCKEETDEVETLHVRLEPFAASLTAAGSSLTFMVLSLPPQVYAWGGFLSAYPCCEQSTSSWTWVKMGC